MNVGKYFSKGCKILINSALFLVTYIVLSSYFFTSNYYFILKYRAALNGNHDLCDALKMLESFSEVLNWILIIIFLIFVIIQLIRDKKLNKDISILWWYLFSAIAYIIGLKGLALIVIPVSTLIISVAGKSSFSAIDKPNKGYKLYIITSAIVVFILIGVTTGLFGKIIDIKNNITSNDDSSINPNDSNLSEVLIYTFEK